MYLFFWTAILLAIIYDVLNGYNDGGSIIGTLVSAPFLSPMRIVLFVCFFELCGMGVIYFVGMRIAQNIFHLSRLSFTPEMILAALSAAVIWKIISIALGIPTSSSHSLIGGLVGAILIAYDWRALNVQIVTKFFLILLLTPLVSFVAGYTFMRVEWLFLRLATPKINRFLSKAQLVTAALVSTLHGATEPQKTMAVMVLILVAFGYQSDLKIKGWIIMVSVIMIALGILAGGWRIAKTFSRRLLKIRPIDSVTTQLSTSLVVLLSATFGGTFSTSQIIGSSLLGASVAQRNKQINWRVARNILIAWLVTIPLSALLAMIIWKIIEFYFPQRGGLWV